MTDNVAIVTAVTVKSGSRLQLDQRAHKTDPNKTHLRNFQLDLFAESDRDEYSAHC